MTTLPKTSFTLYFEYQCIVYKRKQTPIHMNLTAQTGKKVKQEHSIHVPVMKLIRNRHLKSSNYTKRIGLL